MMAQWCLKDLNYDTVDFFANARRESGRLSRRAADRDSRRRASSKERIRMFSLLESHKTHEVLLQNAKKELKEAIFRRERRSEIPHLISIWPSDTLRLCDVVTEDECLSVFRTLDELWTSLFGGLMLLSETCQLSRLDLSNFVPSDGLLYTMLQLVPLLALPESSLDKDTVYNEVSSTLGLTDTNLLGNLNDFLTCVLQHPIYHCGKHLRVPEKGLQIVLDFLPVSADRLSFLCLATARGIQHLTRVDIQIRTLVYTYAEPQKDMHPMDPALPLATIRQFMVPEVFAGLAVLQLPSQLAATYFDHSLPTSISHFTALQKLCLSDSEFDLTADTSLREHLCACLTRLPQLIRLDLSGSCLFGELRHLLDAIKQPLEYLCLSHCVVDCLDITALTESKHAGKIKDLDLSGLTRCKGQDPASPSYQNGDLKKEIVNKLLNQVVRASEDISPLSMVITENIFLFQSVVFLDISTHENGPRIPYHLLETFEKALIKLASLKHLSVEGFSLYDEDIYQLVQNAVELSSIQSLSLTRSVRAPTLDMPQKAAFWKNMHDIKRGKLLRTSIENISTESLD